MGGREAIRGFAIQTLICLLDSFDLEAEWETVTIEPDSNNEKVDIFWTYVGGKTKAVQVKSSKNAISRTAIEQWCEDLKGDVKADEYELRLAGPITTTALHGELKGVRVPAPTSVIVGDLIEQAITKLDRFLANSGIDRVPMSIRELLVDICASKMLHGSVVGQPLSREMFSGWLLRWITAAYPEALNIRLGSNCDVLLGAVEIRSPFAGSRAFRLGLPVSVYNLGAGLSVLEWFYVDVTGPAGRLLYKPVHTLERNEVEPFAPFAIGPNSVVKKNILFEVVSRSGFYAGLWELGKYELKLLAKFSKEDTPRTVSDVKIDITGDHMALLASETGRLTVDVTGLHDYLDRI